jgi:NAD(P)-dependent dehydrogenase (short-subunit alcohol dehydrogenase family)
MSDSMRGKTCLITGATFGIGKATARGIARCGARVVIVGRDAERTPATVAWLRRESGNEQVEYLLADLFAQADLRRLAQEFAARHTRLDVLVNNAGGFFSERATTADGFERTWALNHLAYFRLTLALLPLLKASAPARIVNVASNVHARGRIDFDDLGGARRYDGVRAYCQSKLANVLFTYALARRLAGTGVTANCLHPGMVATGLSRNMRGIPRLFMNAVSAFILTPEQGASTSIHVATSPDVAGVSGKYFVKCNARRSCRLSYDEALQERLWAVSLQQTGLDIDHS